MELLLTAIVGLFMLIGSSLIFITKNNNKIINISTGLGFGILLFLVIFELIPETIELFGSKYGIISTICFIALLSAIGITVLKLLDKFIPDHDSNENTKKHFLHISIVTSIAIVIHNVLEGIIVYTTLLNNLNVGILICLGVGLHNIPLGMFITSSFYKATNNYKKTLLIMILLSLSTFIGGFILYSFSNFVITDITYAIILSLTVGMLIYIILYELLPKVINNKKESIIGIIISLIIAIISALFE